MNSLFSATNSKCKLPGRVNGFTLLELLVVIVIVSILFSFLALSIRIDSPKDLIKEEAQRLNRLLTLALDESVFRNTEIGLEFNARGYQFLELNEGKWQTVEGNRLLRTRELPNRMEIELAIEQVDIVIGDMHNNNDEVLEQTGDQPEPQVFLLSSEEITPEFSARFTIPGEEASYIVSATFDGRHEVKPGEL